MSPTNKAASVAAGVVAAVALAVGVPYGIAAVPIALVVLTLVSALAFVAIYTHRHWRTPVGVNLMALAVVMVIETSLAILGVLFGTNWPFRDEIRAAAWSLVAYVLIWRVGLLFTLGLGQAREPEPLPGHCPTCGRPFPPEPGALLLDRHAPDGPVAPGGPG